MTATKKQIIHVASKEQLLFCRSCYLHLWHILGSLTHLTNEQLIEEIEAFLRDLDILGLDIRYSDGRPWPIPYIFNVFPCHDEVDEDLERERHRVPPREKDGGRRWISNFRMANAEGTEPLMYCTKPASLPRLELLELYAHATVAKYTRGPDTPRCSLTHLPLGW
ncbi:MAG: hypothetical protein KC643_23995 [Nitrospira sp.]|nr:hypothetical protein [Nitrospira sp.]